MKLFVTFILIFIQAESIIAQFPCEKSVALQVQSNDRIEFFRINSLVGNGVTCVKLSKPSKEKLEIKMTLNSKILRLNCKESIILVFVRNEKNQLEITNGFCNNIPSQVTSTKTLKKPTLFSIILDLGKEIIFDLIIDILGCFLRGMSSSFQQSYITILIGNLAAYIWNR